MLSNSKFRELVEATTLESDKTEFTFLFQQFSSWVTRGRIIYSVTHSFIHPEGKGIKKGLSEETP